MILNALCAVNKIHGQWLIILPASYLSIDHIKECVWFLSLHKDFSFTTDKYSPLSDRSCQAVGKFLLENSAAIIKERQHLFLLPRVFPEVHPKYL